MMTMEMTMEKKVQILYDVYQIQNLASAYVNSLHYGRIDYIINDLFTTKTPGQKIQITDWGVWEGVDAANRLFNGMHLWDNPTKKLGLVTNNRHEVDSPFIQVAEDGESAIGVWFAPGYETWPCGQANLTPWWCWGGYWMAFRKEEGEWRIWQMKFVVSMDCDMNIGMVEGNTSPKTKHTWDKFPKETLPDREGVDYIYHPVGPRRPDMLPLPKPYKTWSDDMSII